MAKRKKEIEGESPSPPFYAATDHLWQGDPRSLGPALDLIDQFRSTRRVLCDPVILQGDPKSGKTTALKYLESYACTPKQGQRTQRDPVTFITFSPGHESSALDDFHTALKKGVRPRHTPSRQFRRVFSPLTDYLVMAATALAPLAGVPLKLITTRFFRGRDPKLTVKEAVTAAIRGAHKKHGTGIVIAIDDPHRLDQVDLTIILNAIENRTPTEPAIGLIITARPQPPARYRPMNAPSPPTLPANPPPENWGFLLK